MLSIIFLVVTTALTAFLTGFLNNKLGVNIQGFSIFVIFPIGAFLVGALSVSGIFIGNKLANKPIKKQLVILAMIVGVLSFFTSTYADYKFTLKEIETELANQLAMASEEEKRVFYGEVSFVNYLKEIHDNSTISLSVRNRKGVTINNSLVSKISFWLSVIGGLAGGWFAASLAIGERTKDDKTGEYRDLKYLAIIADEKYEAFEQALAGKDFVKEVSVLLKENLHDKSLADVNRVVFKALKTRSSGEGQIVVRKYIQVGKNSRLEKEIEKDLTPEQAAELMSVILSINPKEKF